MKPMLALSLLLIAGATSQAQAGAPSCESAMAKGRQAFVVGDYTAAKGAFEAAARASPTCSRDGELAGDWLGRVLFAMEDVDEAFSVWERSIESLSEQTWSLGGDALVGSYLEALVVSGYTEDARAAVAFDLLLRPSTRAPQEGQSYTRLLAQIATVVPDSVRESGFVEGRWQRGVASGGELARWWVGQDPYPGTGPNERIHEHLQRVGQALADYPAPSEPQGYDDRGSLLVRFGPPQSAFRLSFDDSDLIRVMTDMNVGVTPASFRDNEVWVYPDQPEPRTYVLAEQAGTYSTGGVEDLFPASLRRVTGLGQRREDLKRLSLLAMQYAYGKLATLSLDYGAAWSSASAALDRIASPIAPDRTLARGTQARASQRELEYADRRIEREPPSQGRVTEGVPLVPFAGSWARFRSEQGGTIVRLAWEHQADTEASLALSGTVVCAPGTRERSIEATVIQRLPSSEPTEVISECVSSQVPMRSTGLAVQLDLFDRTTDGFLGERLATTVWEIGDVRALHPTELEMSDLWPLDASRDRPLAARSIEAGAPLSLYFEAYGFKGRLDRSRISIEYEVVRRRNGSLLRRTREIATTSSVRLYIQGTQTEQFVVLDTTDWQGADVVEVAVSLTDTGAGTTMTRTVVFDVLP